MIKRIFWPQSQPFSCFQILDFLKFCNDSQYQNYVLIRDNDLPFISLYDDLSNTSFITLEDALELTDVNEVYSFEQSSLSREYIPLINPEFVYFSNKDLSRTQSIATEAEIYFLKFYNSEFNLLPLQTLLNIHTENSVTTVGELPAQNKAVLIDEIASNDEIFFWRKLLQFQSQTHPLKLYTTKKIFETIQAFGKIENIEYYDLSCIKDLIEINQWILRDSQWSYILNHKNQQGFILKSKFIYNESLSQSNFKYIEKSPQVINFQAILKILKEQDSSQSNKATLIEWQTKWQTWDYPGSKSYNFQEVIKRFYFIYWNYWLYENDISLDQLYIDESVTEEKFAIFKNSLTEFFNILDLFKGVIENKDTNTLKLEQTLSLINSELVKKIEAIPLLSPLYTSFNQTLQSSRNLSLCDIKTFYLGKISSTQTFISVIYELCNSFDQLDKTTVRL